MVQNFKAMVLVGAMAAGSIAATQAFAGFTTAGLANVQLQSVAPTVDGAVSNFKSEGLLIQVKGNGKGKGNGSNGGGKGGNGGNASSTSSSSGGAGSVPVPSPLLLILGMVGFAAFRRRNA